MSSAAPKPLKNPSDSENAPGGKSNAIFVLKWVSPATMIHPIVPTTPPHNPFDSRPMTVIRRYSSSTASRHMLTATTVPLLTCQVHCSCPTAGKSTLDVFETYTCSSPGQRYAAHPARPRHPAAMDNGAENESCQMNRNEISRPSFFGP